MLAGESGRRAGGQKSVEARSELPEISEWRRFPSSSSRRDQEPDVECQSWKRGATAIGAVEGVVPLTGLRAR